MSGQSIGQIVGTVVGFWIGGPIGAAIGGAAGGYVGSTFDPTQKIEGPRLNDLRLQSSTYGNPLPLVYGPDNRLSGTVIWSSGLKERRKKKKSGGKGGGGGSSVTTYTYSTSAAVSLGEGPCKNLSRIWANSKVLFDVQSIADEVTRLQDKADAYDAQADAAEAEAALYPEDAYLQQEAVRLRDLATSAQTSATNAANNYAAILAGDQPWVLERGSGLPSGPLQYLAFYPGNTTQLPDSVIEAALGAGNVPAYRGTCYVVLGTLQLANFGNSLPNLEFDLDGLSPRTVGAVLRDMCARSGMRVDEYTVRTHLDAMPLSGYTVARAGNAMSAMLPLGLAYAFDTVEQAGEVRFVARGRQAVCVIDPSDVTARERTDEAAPPERATMSRHPDFALAREVAFTYRDPERNFQENTQRATRLFGDSYSQRSESLALTLSAAEARKITDRLLWSEWTDRIPARMTVSDKFRFVVPGDVVMAMSAAGVYLPFRVEHRTRGANGAIELEMRVEDPFIYQGSTNGAAAGVPQTVADSVGDTFVAAINTPILEAGQSATSFMWVMDAAENGWAGGGIYRSTDGGLSFTEMESSGERNVTGTVAAALPSGPSDIWDRTNTITVVLRNDDHELESLSELEVLNGRNACWLGAADGSHGEIIQFATATLVSASPRTYALTDLLRGRRATEHEIGAHGTNELFVFLERDLMRSADYDVADWDRVRHYRGISVYQDEDDVLTSQAFTHSGERARPRAPVLGAGTRDGSNNLIITWVRRIRGFSSGIGYGAIALDEASESYEIDVMSGATVLRTLSASTPTATYTAAQQTSDGITPGNPVTVRIHQISATRGRGHAGVFTV